MYNSLYSACDCMHPCTLDDITNLSGSLCLSTIIYKMVTYVTLYNWAKFLVAMTLAMTIAYFLLVAIQVTKLLTITSIWIGYT